ncbi:MAG: diaminopimelate epimerase [Syntrophomonadaceae bacterium]|nr:diaminopimelate epimerase [Syntrophomonadaceae bacterium]
MNFIKLQGLGNDFILIETSSWDEADRFQKYAEFLCNRNFGIGADGLVLTGRDAETDLFMRIFNPDGSEPEMCGNAIRCVARYAYEYNLVGKSRISVRTLTGTIYLEIMIGNGEFEAVKVDMGEPVLSRAAIPMDGVGENVGVTVEAAGRQFTVTGVSMGNPHCVIFVDDIESVPVSSWGPELEKNEMFPKKTNVEFVQVISKNEMILKVWERGAGATLACGTGACASLVAAVLNEKSDCRATVHLPGGDLLIEWDMVNNHVYMTGPAEKVFEGCIDPNYILHKVSHEK